MLTLVSIVINIAIGCYVLFVIPKRIKENADKLDTISKNQGIIERKIK